MSIGVQIIGMPQHRIEHSSTATLNFYNALMEQLSKLVPTWPKDGRVKHMVSFNSEGAPKFEAVDKQNRAGKETNYEAAEKLHLLEKREANIKL
ncbi:hypothetical protein M5K25_013010 [Dendrobium thyrsiflorum]|uniref:Uncharacterized protein n=1 Tax=Dendrobium thyrsiflorum TaxID=117978 RepID=A0ABD0UZ48_DENTH